METTRDLRTQQHMSTLTVYRRMLRLARRLPSASRLETLDRIRDEFRTGSQADPERRKILLQEAAEHIDYLKIVTPKSGRDPQRGKVKWVMRNGKLVEERVSSTRTRDLHKGDWHRDPEVLAKHNQLHRRMHFMDRG